MLQQAQAYLNACPQSRLHHDEEQPTHSWRLAVEFCFHMAGTHLRKPPDRWPSPIGSSWPRLNEQLHSRTTIRDARILARRAHQSTRHSEACPSGVEVERPLYPAN